MISPPPERGEHVETRFCADIRCVAQETMTADSRLHADDQFRAAGWRSAPHIGGHFCPVHARRR